MSRGPDAATLLARAVEDDAWRAGCLARVADSHWTRWASATFSGARHRMRVEAQDAAGLDRWLAGLADATMEMRGHLLADLTVGEISRSGGMATIDLEALSVEA